MAYNISGIATDHNYLTEVEKLQEELRILLEFDREILFETAIENWKEEKTIDLFFCERGTIVFIPVDFDLKFHGLPNSTSLFFSIVDESKSYRFKLYKNEKMVRKVIENEGTVISESGEKTHSEKDTATTEENIRSLISETIGESFLRIPPNGKAYRYRIIKRKMKKEDDPEYYNPVPVEKLKVKPWWKLW